MPEGKEPEKRSGRLADCIKTAIQQGFTGTISYGKRGKMQASVIFISGKPAGASYSDDAGAIYGDVAVLRLPTTPIYTASPLPAAEAEELARSAHIYHPKRLFAHTEVKNRDDNSAHEEAAGIGILTVRVESGIGYPGTLKIELWNEGRICATDAPDPNGKASFRLLKGEYECLLREGIRLVGRTTINYPGGDMEITVPGGGTQ